MFPYLIIFSLASILFFFAPKKKNLMIAIFLIFFILMAGFRDMIGGFDVYIYAEVYEYFQGTSIFLYSYFEKGFLFYYYLLKLISSQREFMFFITAVIMTLLHFYSFRKLSPNLGMSLFIYFCKFFLFSFVYLRQGLAMGIVWLSIVHLINKKYWAVLFLCILALTFHKSSIIFIPFLIISNFKFQKNELGLISFLILFISVTPLSSYLFSFLADNTDSAKISAYVNKGGGINYFYLIEGVMGVYLFIIFRKYFYQDKKTTVIGNGFFLYSVIILASLTNATFIRFSWYYFIFVVIALPYIYNFYKIENIQIKPIFKNLLFVYYTLVFFRLLIVYDNGDFMPYKSIFQDFDRNGKWEFMEYKSRNF